MLSEPNVTVSSSQRNYWTGIFGVGGQSGAPSHVD